LRLIKLILISRQKTSPKFSILAKFYCQYDYYFFKVFFGDHKIWFLTKI